MNRLLLLTVFTLASSGYAQAFGTEDMRVSRPTAGAVTYDVVELDPKLVDLKLYWKNANGQAYESIAALRSVLGRKFLMATNSGIYSEQMAPMGVHVERGARLVPVNTSCASKGNFFKCPNGVFMQTEQGWRVVYTSEFRRFKGHVLEASQSGPILMRRGKIHPAFRKRSGNLKLRSGVGVNSEGHVVFAISEGGVEFWDFAMFFRDTLHCPDALYLDGSISVLTVGEASAPQVKPFVGIWAATKKE